MASRDVAVMKILISFLSTARFGQRDRRREVTLTSVNVCWPHLALYYPVLPPRCFMFLDADGFEFPSRNRHSRLGIFLVIGKKFIHLFAISSVSVSEIFLASFVRAIWSNKPIRRKADRIYRSVLSMSREIWYLLWKQRLSAIFSSPRQPARTRRSR